MSFNSDPTNPRATRAFAHAAIERYSQGEISYSEAFEVIKAASATKKGSLSGYPESLGKHAVVLVEWSVGTDEGEGIIKSRFGGWVMPPDIATDFAKEYGPRESMTPEEIAQLERDLQDEDKGAYTILGRYERASFVYTRDTATQPRSYHADTDGIAVVNPLAIPGIETFVDMPEDLE